MIIHEPRWKIIHGPWLWEGCGRARPLAERTRNGTAVQEASFLRPFSRCEGYWFLIASGGSTGTAVHVDVRCEVCVSLPIGWDAIP